MAMKRCPVCGEKYSDTYKRCPFCEEEEALRRGNPPRRRGGHRVAQKGPSLLSPILIVVIIAMLAILVYLLFGKQIAARLHPAASSLPPAASVTEPAVSAPPAGSSSAAASSGSAGEETDPSALPETLTLSKTDFTMDVGGVPVALTVSGGSGTYLWSSEDDGIASVDENGKVTAISAGTVNIYASDGAGKGTCIVRVKGTGGSAAGTPASGTAVIALNRQDFTLPVGQSFTMTVSGTTSAVAWDVDNNAVASITENGKVTAKAHGTAHITAVVDGQTLKCVVRVP